MNKIVSRKIHLQVENEMSQVGQETTIMAKIADKSKSFKLIQYVKKHKVEKGINRSSSNSGKIEVVNSHLEEQIKEKKKKIGLEVVGIDKLLKDVSLLVDKEKDFDRLEQYIQSLSKLLVLVKQEIQMMLFQSKLSALEEKKNIIIDPFEILKPLQIETPGDIISPSFNSIELQKNLAIPKIELNNNLTHLSNYGHSNCNLSSIQTVRPTSLRTKSPPLHVLDRPVLHGKTLNQVHQTQQKPKKQQQHNPSALIITPKQMKFGKIN